MAHQANTCSFEREYFIYKQKHQDVWRRADGVDWHQIGECTSNADDIQKLQFSWAPRCHGQGCSDWHGEQSGLLCFGVKSLSPCAYVRFGPSALPKIRRKLSPQCKRAVLRVVQPFLTVPPCTCAQVPSLALPVCGACHCSPGFPSTTLSESQPSVCKAAGLEKEECYCYAADISTKCLQQSLPGMPRGLDGISHTYLSRAAAVAATGQLHRAGYDWVYAVLLVMAWQQAVATTAEQKKAKSKSAVSATASQAVCFCMIKHPCTS